MADLFDAHPSRKTSPVMCKFEQLTFESGRGAVRRVAHQDLAAGIELAINEYSPGGASGDAPTHRPGREFGVVIEGELSVEFDGEIYDLSAGDAIAYASTRPHRISNQGSGRTVAAWVNLTS
jgi:uncharacterized cupin superfamily protein